MSKLDIAAIQRIEEEVYARDAQRRLDAGSKDPLDAWMVAYHKGTPEQRKELMKALHEYNEALRGGPFGFLYG